MKKNLLFLSFFLFFISQINAQLNVALVGERQYQDDLNDIWGYVAPDGTEYALVGVTTGFSIVSLADPANPEELFFIPGDQSIWRDIKTWGDYAFVTTDASDDGLLVVDMTNLPNDIDFYYHTPDVLNTGNLGACHNLYIDELGYMYLAGCNLNGGAVLVFDVFTDPYNPIYINNVNSSYAHDVYVKDNLLYSSNLTDGLQLFDVTDKMNMTLQAVQETPFDFTHNAWATDDNQYVFTTDERPNAPVTAYDISDFNDIKELDQYKPSYTLDQGVYPHNAHVWLNFVIVSFYSDGCIVLDATHPDNLVEVANFDTFLPSSTGTAGSWGAYPYLPSGLILVSDIQSGLYVLQPNYVQGAYLEGLVTDITNGNPLNEVEIEIQSSAPNLDYSDNLGEYKTGQANAGTFNVVFKKSGYQTLSVPADFVNGEITILNVEMTPLAVINLTGLTVEAINGDPIEDVVVIAISDNGDTFTSISNGDGSFSLQNIFEGDYQFYAAQWGYLHTAENINLNTSNNSVTLELFQGYQDDFFADLGWTESGNANSGDWERGIPDATSYQGSTSNPGEDVDTDLGEQAYVTGNGGGGAGNDDIDGGSVRLSSPVMDLTTYNQPIVKYRSWFFNDGGSAAPNDQMIISITNGTDEVILETLNESNSFWLPESEFVVSDFITVTDNMQVHFEASDDAPGHLSEGAVDAFFVEEGMPNSTAELIERNIHFTAYPNPFSDAVTLELDVEEIIENSQVTVFNILGQEVDGFSINNKSNVFDFGKNWQAGIYFINLSLDGKSIHTIKVVKN